MWVQYLVNGAEIIGGIAAGAAMLRPSLSRIELYFRDGTQTRRLAPIVESLLKEFRPNGGNSLRDSVTDLQERMKKIESGMEWQNRVLSKLDRKADESDAERA